MRTWIGATSAAAGVMMTLASASADQPPVNAPLVEPAVWSAQADGAVRLDITSSLTGQSYVALIQVPQGEMPDEGWPSLWMLDGFATFPMVQGRALSDGSAPQGLVIGLGFPSEEPFDDRRSESYTPAPDADSGAPRSGTRIGRADDFRRVVLDEIRPEIARVYPLDRARSTLFGFSYGGLFTLDTLLKEPDSFGQYWASSPSVWFSEAQIVRRLASGGEALQRLERGHSPQVTITAGVEEEFPTTEMTAERLAHLARRGMITNTAEVARLLRAEGLDVVLSQLEGKNHMDMLHEGTRLILDAAFKDMP